MPKQSRSPPVTLFTLRFWREEIAQGQSEWRGEVKNLASSEIRYFREWSDLTHLIEQMLNEAEPPTFVQSEGQEESNEK